jgi:hypothetical protein
MPDKTHTPIAIFTYNRPEHTQRMLDSLGGCLRLDECAVTIFSDGPRLPEHAPAIQKVREIVRKWGKTHQARIEEQTDNKGLAHSIVDGVTQLCNDHGRVIVIEDDLMLHPAFLNYMITALDRYESESKVAQISGYMFPVVNPTPPDALFYPFTSSWGWATWKRSWDLFDWDAPGARQALADKNIRRQFSLDNSYPFAEMLEQRLDGKNQSWGILFNWACFSHQKVVLYPAKSLVSNAGMDGSGVHFNNSKVDNQMYGSSLASWSPSHVFELPPAIQVGAENFKRIQKHLHNKIYFQQGGARGQIIRIAKRIKKMVPPSQP